MPRLLSPYQQHKVSWQSCTLCPLCKTRTHVVLARGQIPADVLFIGEAPGASEDVLAKPFIGPAGMLLDQIIERALDSDRVSTCFTNLVACIPLGEDGSKTAAPPQESIEACALRLNEMFSIVKPRLLVYVGSLAAKWVPKILGKDKAFNKVAEIEIVHPAAILRADISARGLAIQRSIVILSDAMAEL